METKKETSDYTRLKPKHEPVLRSTVQAYIETGNAVSSAYLVEKYSKVHPELDFSSAKMRYILGELEELGYLIKESGTSGRIPTLLGLNYYAKYLAKPHTSEFENKIEAILANKKVDIDNTVEKAAQIIADMSGYTMITTNNIDDQTLLKSIDLVVLSPTKATIVLVTSNGDVFSRILNIENNEFKMTDVKTAVRIFKERLVDKPLCEIPETVAILEPILKEAVQKYQELINSFVRNVFGNFKTRTRNKNNVYGKNNIILSQNIQREDLSKMIELIENHSIWESIESQIEDEENIRIQIDNSGTYMSKKISNHNQITEIAIVGATTSKYDDMKIALAMLERILSNKKK
ncbi:heat-inducible transcriptional repressor HrcA [Mycoplasma sp. 2248]|uniref:heat-inducible transcriptional repressor HrcA n=1 Tax=Mycoplasma sp. 2248 TaxID=3108528 RepID=UPI002B1DE57B|nr:heat-inducible transcriptional repressor HrcA [Mycoplasma sp. 2248]MEA4191109.1 heat-inducible transcriptional repressor HrcA [Mycoplasma sp. 2248]